MSHISTLAVKITDLDAFTLACREVGVELRREQKTFKTYNGQKTDCEMAICHPTSLKAYEAGLVREGDHYVIQTDEFRRGQGLNDLIGDNAGKLLQRYAMNAAGNKATAKGWTFRDEVQPDGAVRRVFEPKQQYAQAAAGGGGGYRGSGF